MFRRSICLAALAGMVGGCITAQPLPPRTAAQQKLRDQQVRLVFAKLIAERSNFGDRNFFFGRREYSNARISIVRHEDGRVKRACTKVFMKPLDVFGSREADLSASVADRQDSLTLTMSNTVDIFGSECNEPFVPFPELEALSAQPAEG